MTEPTPTDRDIPSASDTEDTTGPATGSADAQPADATLAPPETGSGRIPAETGEDVAPESGSNPPQAGLAASGRGPEGEAESGDAAGSAEVAVPDDVVPGDVGLAGDVGVPGDVGLPGNGGLPGDGLSGDDVVPGDSDVAASGAPADVLGDEEYLPLGQTELPVGDEVVIDDDTMRRALEAILMVTDEPLPVLTLARAVGRPTGDVSAALGTLAEEYTEQGRGFDLREVGGGWRYYTRVEAAPYVERFVLDGQQARLTQAALETLAVVAYKQPVSRARVSAIRGVNVDGVVRTLVARGLVEEAGADTESQAILYRTTSYFLERMGMQSLDDLPELAPYLPDMDDIEDELAAQTLPPATSPDEPGTGAEDESTAEAAAAKSGTAPADEAGVDEPGDADLGVDGDLSTDESVDLEVEPTPAADAEPEDEAEPTAGDDADTGIDGDLRDGEGASADAGVRDGG